MTHAEYVRETHNLVVKGTDLGTRPLWVQTSALQRTSCVTMGKLLASLCPSVYPSSALGAVVRAGGAAVKCRAPCLVCGDSPASQCGGPVGGGLVITCEPVPA